jgi:hypothetical protein
VVPYVIENKTLVDKKPGGSKANRLHDCDILGWVDLRNIFMWRKFKLELLQTNCFMYHGILIAPSLNAQILI